VIFPDLHEGFSYTRSFLEEPTRLKMFVGSSGEGLFPQFFDSPAGFRELLKEIRTEQAQNVDKKTYQVLIEDDNPELDERIRGIIPDILSLQQDTYVSISTAVFNTEAAKGGSEKANEKAAEQIQKLMIQIADFDFLLRKFQTRQFPVNMPFNPNIHPAFPVLLIDKEARLFGNPVAVTHSLDSRGSAKTQIQCVYARHKDILGDIIAKHPPWINASFRPDAIGEESFGFEDIDQQSKVVQGAYRKLIQEDMGSILTQTLPVFDANGMQVEDKKPETQEEAADLLFDVYLNSGDREAFIESYIRRRIQTFDEALKYLGVKEVNEELLENDTKEVYDATKRTVIEDAKAILIQSGFAIAEI